MKIKLARGMKDVLPNEASERRKIEEKLIQVAEQYAYREIRTPVVEQSELYNRSVGESSDIVQKELFDIVPKGKEHLSLRPEGTAGVVRSFVEHALGHGEPLSKLFYLGPMYRYERSQAGRLREFHQFGIEAIGDNHPLVDLEVIALSHHFFQELQIDQFLRLEINTLANREDRKQYREQFIQFLVTKKDHLCEDCQGRIERNPLRVLDCKNQSCQAHFSDAPSILQHLSPPSQTRWQSVLKGLDTLNIPYTINHRLVRGLDYYSETVFEWVYRPTQPSEKLTGELTLCGGGRYDDLVEELGGAPISGIGFALSIERLMLINECEKLEKSSPFSLDYYVASPTEVTLLPALEVVKLLRSKGYRAECNLMPRKLKAQFKLAERSRARFIVIVGEEEWQKQSVIIKNLENGEQQLVTLSEL